MGHFTHFFLKERAGLWRKGGNWSGLASLGRPLAATDKSG